MEPSPIDAANRSDPYKVVVQARLRSQSAGTVSAGTVSSGTVSSGTAEKPRAIRDKIQPLPNLAEHTASFKNLALDSVSTSESSRTLSTDSSSRSRGNSEASQKKDIDDTQRASLLIDVIKNSEEDWGAFCLASGNIIAPDAFIGLIVTELEHAIAQDDDDTIQSLIQFCLQWLNAHKNSESARRAKTALEKFVPLVRSHGFGSMEQLLEDALKPIQIEPNDEIPVTAKPQDFAGIIDQMVTKNDSTTFVDDVATDLRMQQITLFTQLTVKHVEVEYENPIPVGLQAYVQYNRSITLFTGHTILAASVNEPQEHQGCLIKFFLKLAIASLKKGDFELAGSIWEGLNGQVREQCGELWASVTVQSKYSSFVAQLGALFSPKDHFKALFESMNSYKASGKPYVPYVKAYLDKVYEIRALDPIIVDRQGSRRFNSINKVRHLKEHIDAYLDPQKRFSHSGVERYHAATNLVSKYLKQMQPLSNKDLLLLGFPGLTEEVCYALTPFQRWDLKMRFEAEHEPDLLDLIKKVQRKIQDQSLIDALCTRKETSWPLLILSNESIIDTYTLFTTIAEHIDTPEKGFPLLTFCLEWLQANASTMLGASAKAACARIIEGASSLKNGMINALAKRVGEFECKSSDRIRAPLLELSRQPLYDFEDMLLSIDLSRDDLMENIAADLTVHLSCLYFLLTPHDLITKKWACTPAVVERIENHFNALTAYVKATLDAESDKAKQNLMLRFYLGIVDKCLKKGDFSNAFTLYLVIDSSDYQKSAPVADLERWRALFSPLDNFRALRTRVEAAKETAIPYIGLVMKDLVAMEENPALLIGECDPMYNFDKLVQIKAIIDRFFAFKPYLEAHRGALEAYVPYTNLVSHYLQVGSVKKN